MAHETSNPSPPSTAAGPAEGRTHPHVKGDNRVFISYSRRDAALVRAIYDELAARGVGIWVDWEDIPPSAEWWAEITRAIDSADAFAVVISPDSIESRVCADELAHALAAGKRLIPLLHRELPVGKAAPDALARLNWIFVRETDPLAAALDRFVEALTIDLELVRMHARLLVRAREWHARSREASYLLRGADLDHALDWLGAVGSSGPMPTDLHRDYLMESQRAQREQSERWRRLYEEALARDLAGRSQLLASQRGTALPLAALLAVEAARRSPSLQTDLALRNVLRLMPRRHAVTSGLAAGEPVIAHAVERMATLCGTHVDVWALDRHVRVASLDAGGTLLSPGLSLMPCTLAADGTRVAAIVDDRHVRVWQVEDGRVLLSHDCGGQARGLAFSRDATRLAVTLDGTTSVILDVAGTLPPATLTHGSTMDNVAWRPDGTEMVLWGCEAAEIWNPGDGTRLSTIPLGHAGGPTTHFEYSPRGEYLALLQRTTYHVNVFHVASRRRVFQDTRHVDIAFHPDDKAFAVASPEWDVTVWDLPSGTQRFRMQHDNSVWRVGFNADGTKLWSSSADGTTRVWELERKGAEIARFAGETPGPRGVAFSRDGWRLHRIFDDRFETSDARGFVEWRLFDVGSPVFDVDAAPGQPHLALGTRNGTWMVVDYSEHAAEQIRDAEPGRNAMGEQLTMTRFVTPSHLLVARSFGPRRVRDLTGKVFEDGFAATHEDLVVSDREGLVVRVTRGELFLWDVTLQQGETRPLRGDTKGLAISANGALIALLGEDGVRFTVGRKGSARAPRRRIALEGEVALALDSEGRRLALWRANDQRSSLRIVDVATGVTRARWEMPSRLHELRFDESGAHVVLASKDGTVQVWQADAGVALATFQHPAEATTACFTPDEGLVASGSWDGTARIWPWRPEPLIRAACDRLDRDMTAAEWEQYLPNEPYRATRTLT